MFIQALDMRRDVSGQPSAILSARFHSLALRSDFLVARALPLPSSEQFEQFVFEGPHGGGDPIRIGFFAGIHGDEQSGSDALLSLAEKLVANPVLAEGYNLHFYPICNPSGFDAGTRLSKSGKDLNREFWRDSREPEVLLLEREIHHHRYHGLVSLHSDDTSAGLYGFVRGAVLTRSLLEPALRAAEQILPRNEAAVIDGFPAERGIISECYEGILTSPPKLENSPFEIIFETPHQASSEKQVEAFVVAILSILAEYRKFIAFAADL
jgi:predicted deacylase